MMKLDTPRCKEVIYDFGTHNGGDIEYYLKKGRKIVGVEANPSLVAQCADRFRSEIDEKRLVLINAAISTSDDAPTTPFYIHKFNTVLNQLHRPCEEKCSEFQEIRVPQIKATSIIEEHGHPYYLKIDLEGCDQEVLAELFGKEIYPDFVSAESHSIRVFCLLAAAGYKSFNLVDGSSVAKRYKETSISTFNGVETYSFPFHSAGPFGEDIRTPWLDENKFFCLLSNEGLGWKDIHATNQIQPASSSPAMVRRKATFREHLSDLFPSFIRSLRFRLRSRNEDK